MCFCVCVLLLFFLGGGGGGVMTEIMQLLFVTITHDNNQNIYQVQNLVHQDSSACNTLQENLAALSALLHLHDVLWSFYLWLTDRHGSVGSKFACWTETVCPSLMSGFLLHRLLPYGMNQWNITSSSCDLAELAVSMGPPLLNWLSAFRRVVWPSTLGA